MVVIDMHTNDDDKVIAFTPKALDTIRDWLGEVEQSLNQVGTVADLDTRAAVSRVRAIHQILMPGFGKAARVTPDWPDGSLFVAEYADKDTESAAYVFGCILHSDGKVGVHS
jgi:hypothetical protein